MESPESWAIVFLILFLFVSFSFSLIKAVFSGIYAKRDAKDREGREEKVAALVELGGFNETISIGRIFCNVGSGVLGFYLFEMLPWAKDYWILAFLAYMVVACICIYTLTVFCANVLGNLKPDTLAIVLIPLFKWIRLPFAVPAKICHWMFVKILKVMGYDSKLSFLPEERRDAVQADLSDVQGDDGEGLEKEERQMILNIFDFVETPVREIMTPRVDMCAIDADTRLEDLVKVLNTERHSRLPVYKETVDNIVGILSNRDFLQWYTEHHETETFDIMKLVMPPVFVPYHKKIDDMLTDLRKTGNQLAIVVDEYGGTAGLVTLEDILEEIVGEIRDEDDVDEEQDVQKLKDGRYILDPLMTLSDLEYELGVELEAPENSHVETLSGLIQATLGIIPSPGAEVVIKGYTFRVLKMEGNRMEKVLMIQPGKNKPKSGPRTQAFRVT
ncbi:Hemolysin, contains CBS domains [Fibrobacter sp. UWH9]|uniref:hemolysin family protein n=1 Tax=Fibrobacter sp. UWH9 TaxID=1896213 RepID=UPI000918900B|nr:hemolysin family protein [Fibrobacter sp. UWH9]SHG77583.1 Hemolysin, contains CBS domains [Fibrobacter sp. UWH9]